MDERYARNRFRQAVPSVPVKDCAAAIRWYCDKLGFRKDFDDAVLGREVTLFAGVSRGDCKTIGRRVRESTSS